MHQLEEAAIAAADELTGRMEILLGGLWRVLATPYACQRTKRQEKMEEAQPAAMVLLWLDVASITADTAASVKLASCLWLDKDGKLVPSVTRAPV